MKRKFTGTLSRMDGGVRVEPETEGQQADRMFGGDCPGYWRNAALGEPAHGHVVEGGWHRPVRAPTPASGALKPFTGGRLARKRRRG